MRRVLVVLASTLLLAACGKSEPAAAGAAAQADAVPNQRRIDTAIANSKLPGAQGVGRAMSATDRANAQTRQQDSLLELMNRK